MPGRRRCCEGVAPPAEPSSASLPHQSSSPAPAASSARATCGRAANQLPGCHSHGKADGQETRQVMRADIDRVEMQRQGEHHHRVLRTRRKSDDHVRDAETAAGPRPSGRMTATAVATANEPKAAPR